MPRRGHSEGGGEVQIRPTRLIPDTAPFGPLPDDWPTRIGFQEGDVAAMVCVSVEQIVGPFVLGNLTASQFVPHSGFGPIALPRQMPDPHVASDQRWFVQPHMTRMLAEVGLDPLEPPPLFLATPDT